MLATSPTRDRLTRRPNSRDSSIFITLRCKSFRQDFQKDEHLELFLKFQCWKRTTFHGALTVPEMSHPADHGQFWKAAEFTGQGHHSSPATVLGENIVKDCFGGSGRRGAYMARLTSSKSRFWPTSEQPMTHQLSRTPCYLSHLTVSPELYL